jgi:hypothetical protein
MNVTFDDGQHATGSFVFNAATGDYSAWNISVTAGTLPFSAYDYKPVVDSGFLGFHTSSFVELVAFPPGTGGRFVHLGFANALTDTGGLVNLLLPMR